MSAAPEPRLELTLTVPFPLEIDLTAINRRRP